TVAGGNGEGSAANQLTYPQDLAVDTSGNTYIADTENNRIQKWAPGETEGTTVAGGNGEGSAANQLTYPKGVAVDTSGNIYIADTDNQRIQKWGLNATEGTIVAGGNGQGSTANKLKYPLRVALDTSGNIYIADTGNQRIQKWAPGATEGTTVAGGNGVGSAANQLAYPLAVAVDTTGNIYIADTGNNRIQKWAFLSQSVTFGALNDRAINAPAFAVSATASSGLPVTFSSTTESVCAVIGTVVILTGATGECTIRATQAGSDLYAPATVDRSFAAKDAQSITFGALKDRANTAGSFAVTGTASSGLPVAFSSTTGDVCFVEPSGDVILYLVFLSGNGANGTCTIEATQDGDATHLAAPAVERSFDVTDPHDMVIGIGDTVMHEGSGPTAKTIAVDLGVSAPFAEAVCVWWRTANVTATGVDKLILFDGSEDYMRMGVSKPKFAIIAANKTIAKLSVKVNYDTAIEADETFQIIIDKVTTQTAGRCVWDANASTDSRIKVTRAAGTVTILDDDTPE
ncbi:MAG: NHL repeat-containing protein, partial [Acidimicrobiia bacterium]|nr:NHL repeat-containing protein [Acidimicrobiia bacterium]